MTKEELDKEIELVQERNRAAIVHADALLEKYALEIPRRIESTERVLRELDEAARRR